MQCGCRVREDAETAAESRPPLQVSTLRIIFHVLLILNYIIYLSYANEMSANKFETS